MKFSQRVYTKLKHFVSLLVFIGAAALCCAAYAYDYPFDNPYMATVVGTPSEFRAPLPENIPHKIYSLQKIEDREIPEVLRYGEKLKYSLVYQRGEAPLVFTIAGTGGSHDTENNMILMRAFYQAGFHVVGLTSPSHPDFVISASSTSVPGHLQQDSEDLYGVMKQIWDRHRDRIEVSEFHLTGYSLGGTQAAFLAKIDDEKRIFGFKKVLLINPSLTLYNSVSKLDRMLENIPGGIDNFHDFYAALIKKISEVYKRSDTVEFDEDLIFNVFKEEQPDDEQLAAIIGAAFRMSLGNMIFTSDIMTNYGFIKPKNVRLTKSSSMVNYAKVTMRVGFTDYYHEYFYPYFLAQDPSLTRESLVELLSLRSIENYLRREEKIGVVHNQDDIILSKGEIDFFPEVFGSRAKIYPKGGHMGNLQHRDTLSYIVEYFKK
jgi:pimeloyl-ACP methyl ester carboxylesterase